MELKQLQYFLAAARRLNFTKAAQDCFIVQSAMSQQISALEKDLGVTLFVRKNRALCLTIEGEAFREEADRILNQVAFSTQLVRGLANGYRNVLRLGCHGDLMRAQLPEILQKFRKAEPETRLLVIHDYHDQLLSALFHEEVDCFLTVRADDFALHGQLGVLPVGEDALCAMLPKDHFLAGRKRIAMRDLRGESMILLSGADKMPKLAEWAECGAPIQVYCCEKSQRSIETLVAAGYGVSLCMESACRSHPGIVYPFLEHKKDKLFLVWDKKRIPSKLNRLISFFLNDPSQNLV